MYAQTAINGEHNPAALFMLIQISDSGMAALKQQITAFYEKRHVLTRANPVNQVTTALAFSKEVWQKLHNNVPANFPDMPVITGKHPLPAVPANLFVHITSKRPDLCYELAAALLDGWQGVKVLDERQGFRFHDYRDLTGFIDGIENPSEPSDQQSVTLLDASAGDCQGGSFVFAQRFVHDLTQWNQQTVDEQEKTIGRTKWEGMELADDVKPPTAHNARSNINHDIMRYSLPYASAGGEKGLFFLAYTNDLTVITTMIQRMYGLAEDGITDRLLDFTTAVGGNYFFAPPQDLLESMFELDDV